MQLNIVTATELQKQPSKVFKGSPIQLVFANNKMTGILFTGGLAQKVLDSGLIEQLQEELWEVQDEETSSLIAKSRLGKTKPVSLAAFRKKYGV